MEPAGLTLKLLLVGDSGVGKSSLLRRVSDGAFEPRLTPTVGIDFKVKNMVLEGRAVQLAIWKPQIKVKMLSEIDKTQFQKMCCLWETLH